MSLRLSASRQSLLDQLIQRGTLANAYLFHGQTGSFLSEAAAYLSERFVGSSENNPDVVVVNPYPKRITLELIKDLQDRVKYGPSHHAQMIVILHRVESMTTEAANAFLKTLEEAQDGVTFILLTLQHHAVLPTIKSRCQHLYFPPLTYEELQNDPDILQLQKQCHGQLDFILDYLETETTPPEAYISYSELKKLPLLAKFQWAESLSKEKEAVGKILLCWIREGLQLSSSAISSDLTAMVTLSRRLTTPINLRLHLDSLLLGLHYSR